jgi:Extensin-like protein C-terminus
VSRLAPRDGRVPCHPELLQTYRGARVRLEPPLTLAAPFQERVARFENLVAEVGLRVYGRAPSRILNAGAYACRAVEHRQQRLSEHALGNALDVTGFRFPPLPKPETASAAGGSALRSSLPRALERGFTITVARAHATTDATEDATTLKHREFFDQLRGGLRDAGIFRGMLGPSDPRHATHLHLDMGPWYYERL